MLIAGVWQTCDDGVTRPVVRARVQAADRGWQAADFLIDSGADRTVFSAFLERDLGLEPKLPLDRSILQGIGGTGESIVVQTVLMLIRDDKAEVHLRGEFAAFTDLAATDLSILGRDVLSHFDVILSRRRKEVLLLAQDHQYRVERAGAP
jgi:hypothetical protein